MEDDSNELRRRALRSRRIAALGAALAFALGIYLLLQATRPSTGVICFSFLLLLPAVICAFIAILGDPLAEAPHHFYVRVPVWLGLAVILISLVVLREGVICVVMLSPLWFVSGIIGAETAYWARRSFRRGNDRLHCSVLLALPLLAIQVEPYIPLPQSERGVERSIIVQASPDRIWPLLRGIPDVRPGEGRWNITQDVFGVPRPLGARLVGEGVGASRMARWGSQIHFQERIIAWDPGKTIRWRFLFDDVDGWRFTDRHLMPDSAYFRVTTGGYRLEPLPGGRTRVTVDTRYWMQTPVNSYSALWGEFFLGDLENNLLALVKQRAEGLSEGPRVG